MKKLLYFVALYLFIITATADDFTLSSTESRENYYFIQLQHGLGKGSKFTDIFKKIDVDKDDIAIRIVGGFSDTTNKEIISYYKRVIPIEFEKAIKSSGNLHNPTLKPLIKSFSSAYKTTQLFQDIDTELNNSGYTSTKIGFEKYTINAKGAPKIWVADIWLRFSKGPPKAN
jgi:hypothetical protein